ncbi:MAG: glycosyl transferase [Comamonadaceae bacterium]|nr:MAG: glycosyl transferase [Comamonadaceae bacterium]
MHDRLRSLARDHAADRDGPAGRPGSAGPERLRRLRRLAAAMVVATALAVAVAAAALVLIVRLLAPQPGEWAVPWRLGPVRIEVGVPQLVRLVTSPAFAPWLAGHGIDTRWGPVTAEWQPATRELALHCRPCSLPVAALGPVPLRLERLTLRMRNDFDRLAGTLEAAAGNRRIALDWLGEMRADGIALGFGGPPVPIADAYAVLAPSLPELATARIGGSVVLRGHLHLPSGRLELRPQVDGFRVEGLGTEAWVGARSACGPGAGLRHDDWLVRAVIAAEDQRFHTHAGFDLQELIAAFELNREHGAVRRGASTLDQQLAKLLVTGSGRDATRKLRELLYAVEMERTLGKSGILRLYLDNAPWGDGLCGAEAAARHYFGRGARALAPVQAVWLASMLNNPRRAADRWALEGRPDPARTGRIAHGLRSAAGLRPIERRALRSSLARGAEPRLAAVAVPRPPEASRPEDRAPLQFAGR